jgi:glycerophosphoryl diester phosphodiesterase
MIKSSTHISGKAIVLSFFGVAFSFSSLFIHAGEALRFIAHRGDSAEAPENTMTALSYSRPELSP